MGDYREQPERKEKEVFVRNIAYDVTKEDLIDLFEEFGPIKRASIAEQDGTSKGFGFVKFALEEDANAAVQNLQNREFHGRKLILEIAVQKGQTTKPEGAKPVPETTALKKPKQTRAPTATSADLDDKLPRPSMRLVVTGLPVSLKKKDFRNALRPLLPSSRKVEVEVVNQDHPLLGGLCAPPGRCMLLTFPSRKTAAALVAKLDNMTARALGLGDAAVGREKISARLLKDVTPPENRKQKCRVILRNLSFQAVEENVASKLSRCGPLVEVYIPKVEVEVSAAEAANKHKRKDTTNGKIKLRPRGFAFATFLCEKDARNAVEGGCRDMKICNREFAVDMCLHKHGHEIRGEGEEKDEELGSPPAQSQDDVAALAQREDDESDSSGGIDSDESEGEGEGSEDDSDSGNDEDDDDDEEDEEECERKEKTAPPDDVKEGRTVFVRDLPFDASESDLTKVFRRFGKVELVAIVRDKITGLARGSAFIKFESREAALQCVEAAEILNASSTNPLIVHGRKCRADLAVDRNEAKRLREEEHSAGKDKRNLYLANEGLLVDSSVSFKRHGDEQRSNNDMSEADREKRQRAMTEKKKKLANPLFFVSPTRLCIRNLKKTLNNSDLHNLCMRAAAAGVQESLVSPKDSDAYFAAQCVSVRERTPEKLAVPPVGASGKGGKVILKAKIMLDGDRMRGGAPQSRGYGFVEFRHHVHALACLRELNNNSEYGKKYAQGGAAPVGKASNLIVEFSVENMQKVMILNSRREKYGIQESGGDEAEEEEEDHMGITQPSAASESRKRKLPGGLDNAAEVDEENQDGVEERKVKKSRIERKKELAQKRKEKEQRRRENKRKRTEGEDEAGHDIVRDVNSVSEVSNGSQSKRKDIPTRKVKGAGAVKKSLGDSEAKAKATQVGPNNKSDKGGGTWGGFKRHRAAKKSGGKKS